MIKGCFYRLLYIFVLLLALTTWNRGQKSTGNSPSPVEGKVQQFCNFTSVPALPGKQGWAQTWASQVAVKGPDRKGAQK